MTIYSISKTLSANDSGETGAHQAGMLIPKENEILNFFPKLKSSEKNPRHHLIFHDESEERWEFAFIYYNNKFFGGTRNEYRLTRMTPFIKSNGLKEGDELILQRNEDGKRYVLYKRKLFDDSKKNNVLRLSTQWKIIKL